MKGRTLVAVMAFLLNVPWCFAAPAETAEMTPEEFEAKLHYEQGTVSVGDGMAKFDLGSSFRYLDPDQTDRVLVQGWGNPPGPKTLGMIVPAGMSPVASEGWAVVITYEEDGYVDDKGAESIDYDALLKQMKKGAAEANEERKKSGYEPVELVGWAEPPRYDAARHKLYWAKDLRFGNAEADTLNYNIRVLGRRGVLVLNAVAQMDQLPIVTKSMQQLLPAIEFNPGHRYADYIPGTDKLAEYGIGALVAGTLAAKAGLFKAILAGLIAFKKLILVGLAALAASWRKMFGKKDRRTAPMEPGG